MPTFKHPCPHCGKWIERDVAACPYCGTADPFAPARCPNCRRIVDDPAWVTCPACGTSLKPAAGATATAAVPTAPPGSGTPVASAPVAASPTPASPTPASTCSGCGAPLPGGARFCTVCGTLVAGA